MVKIKLGALKNCSNALKTLLNADVKLSVVFKLEKMLDIVIVELDRLEVFRKKLINDLGEVQADGSTSIKDTIKLEEFTSSYSEFLNTEVELNVEQIDLVTELGDNFKISTASYISIKPFLILK